MHVSLIAVNSLWHDRINHKGMIEIAVSLEKRVITVSKVEEVWWGSDPAQASLVNLKNKNMQTLGNKKQWALICNIQYAQKHTLLKRKRSDSLKNEGNSLHGLFYSWIYLV